MRKCAVQPTSIPGSSEARTPDFDEKLQDTHDQNVFFPASEGVWQMPTTTIADGRMMRVAPGSWRTGDDDVVRTRPIKEYQS